MYWKMTKEQIFMYNCICICIFVCITAEDEITLKHVRAIIILLLPVISKQKYVIMISKKYSFASEPVVPFQPTGIPSCKCRLPSIVWSWFIYSVYVNFFIN